MQPQSDPPKPPAQPQTASPRPAAASSATPKIELLLEEVVKRDASDLHLQVGMPPMLRVDGTLIRRTTAAGSG